MEDGVDQFLTTRNFDVFVVSYETLRIHASRFHVEGACDLLICDEAHRLKNDKTLTSQVCASWCWRIRSLTRWSQALDKIPCARRVLLSGTPMQNDLNEFFAMVEFTNHGVLGTASQFRRHYERPILEGREPDASDKCTKTAVERSKQLSSIVRTYALVGMPRVTDNLCAGEQVHPSSNKQPAFRSPATKAGTATYRLRDGIG